MDETTIFTTEHRARIEHVRVLLGQYRLDIDLSGAEVKLCIAGVDHGFSARRVVDQIVEDRANAFNDYLRARREKQSLTPSA
jgi:hypothetical protein